jgi:peptidoglycan/xylan/chitin deacetylase (PgdA/CDA1 family)
MILAYHEIAPEVNNAYSITCADMNEHLRFIAQCGDAGILGLTFDDGEESQYRYSLPLLEKHRLKGRFFVNVGFVGQSKTIKGWTQHFMNWSQLKDLVRLGHSVQSHGWSHEFLTACSPRELKQQLLRSKQTLEDRLGTSVESISAPGGRWNSRVLQGCREAGYKILFTSDPWASSKVRDGITVRGRYIVLSNTTVAALQKLVKVGGVQLLSLQLHGQLKASARALLGEKTYHRLWRRFMRSSCSELVV